LSGFPGERPTFKLTAHLSYDFEYVAHISYHRGGREWTFITGKEETTLGAAIKTLYDLTAAILTEGAFRGGEPGTARIAGPDGWGSFWLAGGLHG